MFDTIHIGMSGMDGFSKGLKVISNNLANLNTPGFRSATLQFTDAYYQQEQGQPADAGSGGGALFGSGVETASTVLDFHAGDVQQSSDPMDVAISGTGYLIERDPQGRQTYTRDGQMQFDQNGDLVSKTTGKYVMGYVGDGAGALSRLSLDGLRTNPAKATSAVVFSGNLTMGPTPVNGTTGAAPTVNISLNDNTGTSHALVVTFTNGGVTDPNHWTVAITDGTTTVGTGTLNFNAGDIDPTADKMSFTYTPEGKPAQQVTLDFSKNVTAFDTGSTATLAVASQDGFAAGSISKASFDGDGRLTLTYTNGQTATGGRLALAVPDADSDLLEQGGGQFVASPSAVVHVGRANADGAGSITASSIELSNVDLTGQFGNLIVMQRGYQASSNVLSTVNDMLQELFSMQGSR